MQPCRNSNCAAQAGGRQGSENTHIVCVLLKEGMFFSSLFLFFLVCFEDVKFSCFLDSKMCKQDPDDDEMEASYLRASELDGRHDETRSKEIPSLRTSVAVINECFEQPYNDVSIEERFHSKEDHHSIKSFSILLHHSGIVKFENIIDCTMHTLLFSRSNLKLDFRPKFVESLLKK